MRRVSGFLKKILIAYVIVFIILSSIGQVWAVKYNEAAGKYLVDFTKKFIETYCVNNSYYVAEAYPTWTGRRDFEGSFNVCCSAGVWYMYSLALNIDIYKLGFHGLTDTAVIQMKNNPNWVRTNAAPKPGDIVLRNGHTEMYVDPYHTANFGSNGPNAGKIREWANPDGMIGERSDQFNYVYRLSSTIEVDPTGVIKGMAIENADLSNFFFNGVPDGKYSLSTKSFFSLIVEKIGQLLTFLVNLILYLIRAVIVGIAAIFDNIKDWIIYTIADTNVEDEDLEIESLDSINNDEDKRVTLDKLFFNKLELFDINVFAE